MEVERRRGANTFLHLNDSCKWNYNFIVTIVIIVAITFTITLFISQRLR